MDNNKILGIVLTVLGGLVLLGYLDIPLLTEVLGLIAIVLGVLILAGKQSGSPLWGIGLVVGGVLLLANFLGLGAVIGAIITIVVGALLLIAGITKLMGKW